MTTMCAVVLTEPGPVENLQLSDLPIPGPGIEAVGVVDAAPGSDLQPGQQVAATMGGMGRTYDGGYAEYTVVPRSQAGRARRPASDAGRRRGGSSGPPHHAERGRRRAERGRRRAGTGRYPDPARYGGDASDLPAPVLQRTLDRIAAGTVDLGPVRADPLDQITTHTRRWRRTRAAGRSSSTPADEDGAASREEWPSHKAELATGASTGRY